MNRKLFTVVIALIFAVLSIKSVFAQSYYTLSNHTGADSSQYVFDQGDTLYMSVYAPDLNFNQMKKMRWTIRMSDMNESSGSFDNELNGYFRAQFNLDQLPDFGTWKWKARLEDTMGNEAEFEAEFTYGNGMGEDSSHHDETDFEYKGTIEVIGPDSLVIDGITFWVDQFTKIKSDDDHRMLSLSDLQAGDYVKVEAITRVDGSYLAQMIKLDDGNSDHHDNEMEYFGVIDSVGIDFIDVNGLRFGVTSQTEIKGQDHDYLSLSDLKTGLYVKIKAEKQSDGTYIANKIKVKSYYGDTEDNELEFKGRIDSLGSDFLVVNGMRFYTDLMTKVFLDDHRLGSLSDLSAGHFVELKAFLQTDGRYLVRKIEMEDNNYNYKIHFTGIIDSVGNTFIRVFGYRVYVDENTEITGHKHTILTLSDMEKGQRVKIKGYIRSDGTVLASSIKVKSFFQDYVEFHGLVDSVGPDRMRVNHVVFLVDSNTVIFDQNKTPISLAQIKTGDLVEIKARLLSDGSWLAYRIKIENDRLGRIEISGYIDSLSQSHVMVGEITFYVDDSTRILDYTGHPIGFSDLTPGQYVEVKAHIRNDGTYIAEKIKLEDAPTLSVLGAILNGLSADRLMVGGREVIITNTTVILDANYQPTDLSTYPLGSEITLWSEQDGATSQAIQVKLGSTASVNSLNEESLSTFPDGFELKQNYPNPFNPVTTIPFRISGNQFSRVRLEVYNLLGQKIRTLFNGILGAGNYTFRWNATNDFGRIVSSGMYFYKLDVAGKNTVKQMVLLR